MEVCTEMVVVAGVRAPKWNGRHKALCLVCKGMSKFSSLIFVLGSPAQWLHHTVYPSGEKGGDYLFMVDDFILTFHFKHFTSLYLLNDWSVLVSG